MSVCLQKIKLRVDSPPRSPLIAEPPRDNALGAAALMHYTWGNIFKDTLADKEEVWSFDKRFHLSEADALSVPSSHCTPLIPAHS